MADNDPTATAAIAAQVAELDRLFPRREEATGRAMCAGWEPERLVDDGPGRQGEVKVMHRGRAVWRLPPTVRDDVASVTT